MTIHGRAVPAKPAPPVSSEQYMLTTPDLLHRHRRRSIFHGFFYRFAVFNFILLDA